MIQEIQVQGKICTQRLVYTHMHASVVVVKDTNLTDGWSNDTLKESAVALRDTPTFATQNKELSFWWVWTNHTHTHIDTWVHVRLNSSKKNNTWWLGSLPKSKETRRWVKEPERPPCHQTNEIYCLSRTGQNNCQHGVDRMIAAIPPWMLDPVGHVWSRTTSRTVK